MLLGIPVRLYDKLGPTADSFATSIWTILFIAFAALLLLVPFYIWQLVGVWRAATQYVLGHNGRFWAWAAKGIVILNGISVLVAIPLLCYSIYSWTLELVGKGDVDLYELSLVDERTLYLNGGIRHGLAGDIETILDANPKVDSLQIDSYGGFIYPGNRAAKLVADRNLSVTVMEYCFSACTDILLTGDPGVVQEYASFGVHNADYELYERREIAAETKRMRDFLAGYGVPEWFVEKTLETPPDDLWYPSMEALEEAKYVQFVLLESGATVPVAEYCEEWDCTHEALLSEFELENSEVADEQGEISTQ